MLRSMIQPASEIEWEDRGREERSQQHSIAEHEHSCDNHREELSRNDEEELIEWQNMEDVKKTERK